LQELFEELLGGGEDVEEAAAAVAHFHHAHAVAGKAEELALGLLEHREGEDGRPGGEIEDAISGGGCGHGRSGLGDRGHGSGAGQEASVSGSEKTG